jgi:hypothetical protein
MAFSAEGAVPPGFMEIFVAAFKHAKTGKIIRARDYGLKAFRLLVPITRRKKNAK